MDQQQHRTTSTEAGPSSLPLRVLSLDGGGIRGLSSLLILEKIMEELRQAKGLTRVPRPCDYFDLIGGTSTGGIIAIMLGRLSMTVDECIRAYKKVAQQAFTPKRTSIFPGSSAGAFSAKQLEAAIKRTIQDHCIDPRCMRQRRRDNEASETCPHGGLEFRDGSSTKTVVLAITKANVDASATLFKTYDSSESLSGCTIWQVARATSAATTFFKPIRVGRDDIEFIDAAFGYNNPCEVLIAEAQKQFPDRTRMNVLSIGTGLGDVVEINDTRMSILKALKSMTTTTKKVALRLDERYGDSGVYHRFNVDQGLKDVTLSDWEKSSKISAHTRNYLAQSQTQRAIAKFIKALTEVPRVMPEEKAAEEPESNENRPVHLIPFAENERFVARVDTLNQLKHILFGRNRVRQTALVGLGGIGKTQVGLHLAHWAKKNMPAYSVLWISAFSATRLNQACTELVQKLGIQYTDKMDAKEAVWKYLDSERAGRWFLVIDNVDDMDMLQQLKGETASVLDSRNKNGRVLVTTRSQKVAVTVAGSAVVRLVEMNEKEATQMLENSLISKDQLDSRKATSDLLKRLANIPLAIAQAAAYININQITIREYLRVLRHTDQDEIELMSERLHDRTHCDTSQGAVATTWIITFNQIRKTAPPAARLLSFIAYIEPTNIPRSLLPKFETKKQKTEAIGTLVGYGFLRRQKGGQLFDMHRLVYLATRAWNETQNDVSYTRRDVIFRITRVFPEPDWEHREIWRQFLPHALRALHSERGLGIDDVDLGRWVGQCLRIDGRMLEAVTLLEKVVMIEDERLAEESSYRLRSQHALALAYLDKREYKRAIQLLEHVVAVQGKELGEDDDNQLALQQVLARAYLYDGQAKKAMTLLEHVVAVREKTLVEDHPELLTSQSALADVYRSNGQGEKAIKLLEHVVAVREKTLVEDHPDRLASQHNLAVVYRTNGKVEEAIKLLQHVVAIREKTLVEEHPDRLGSQHHLAWAYMTNGKVKEAAELAKHVVGIYQKTLPESQPERKVSEELLKEIRRRYQ